MSKVNEDQAVDIVFNYLSKQTRPFSAGEVHNNLQTEFGLSKGLVQKVLDKLVLENTVKEKTYGKSKIYFANQDDVQTVDEAAIRTLEAHIQKYTEEYQSVSKELKSTEVKMTALSKQLPMTEIQAKITSLTKDVTDMTEKLEKLKKASKGVDPAENIKIRGQRKYLVQEWRKRKRLANTALDMIMEGYPASKKKLMEEVGIETDEDNDAVMPQDV